MLDPAVQVLVLVRGPPTPPSRINPPPSPSMRDSGTLKAGLSGLADAPRQGLADLSRHASRRIAYSGRDWARLDQTGSARHATHSALSQVADGPPYISVRRPLDR
ncbi:uncharacterized protein TrAtP1_012725 [Trichoderma atroviride]|uniref:uncharacterized protein n=1 Tax=Hypocrea atroviridis TaxID=63577 RepID=UPI0033194151|nr:hypothetical protein TrAtP1_012725 [Trichoderma atroviride]